MDLLPNLGNVPQAGSLIDFREIGATGLRRFSGFVYDEFLLELTGWKGAAIYKEMSYNDPVVAAVLFAITMLCRQVDFYVEPASDDQEDLKAAEFLEGNMDDMSQPWPDTLTEILSMLVYGYSPHEIVYKRRMGDNLDPSKRSMYDDGKIGWRKWPIRSQDTIYRWQFDDHGGIQGVEQLAPPHYYHVTVPIEKLLLFRTTTEKNNPEGRSALRGAYRPWYMKKNIENIEAIGIERDLAGLPCAWVPPELMSAGASNNQKQILAMIKEMVTNVRRNNQEGMILPLQYTADGKPMYDFKLLSSAGARQFDTNAVITRYDNRIAMTLLADFMLLGQQKVGSFSLVDSRTNLFSTAIGAFLDIVCDVVNRYAVPRLFQFNDFMITKYPKIKRGNVGNVELATLADYINKLVASGMPVFPSEDGALEKQLLEFAHLSAPKDATKKFKGPPMPNAKGKNLEEIPASGVQTPTGSVSDRTPADGQPKPATVTTNASGTTEDTGKKKNPQDENQFTTFGPQGRP